MSTYQGLVTTTTIWCSCEQLTQYLPVKESWSGDQIEMKCQKCGHIIKVERSLVTPMDEKEAA